MNKNSDTGEAGETSNSLSLVSTPTSFTPLENLLAIDSTTAGRGLLPSLKASTGTEIFNPTANIKLRAPFVLTAKMQSFAHGVSDYETRLF
jgi:hypothetical protein